MESKKLLLGVLLLLALIPAAFLLTSTASHLLRLPLLTGEPVRELRRSQEAYRIPDIGLVDQNGKKVRFKSYLEGGKPVLLDFIYGGCSTIGPAQSASFVTLQQKLGAGATKIRMISVSTDPEHDSPRVMNEYLKKYHRQPGWDFLTGTRSDIETLVRAFDGYKSVSNHNPLMLILNPMNGKWLRLSGIVNSPELMQECSKLIRR
jgi:protein SCO1/2